MPSDGRPPSASAAFRLVVGTFPLSESFSAS
jgi:hypothetical protein